jgi:hypothetical protein
MRAVLAALVCLLVVTAPAYGDGFNDWEADGTDLAPSYSWRSLGPFPDYDTVRVFRCSGGGACDSTPLQWHPATYRDSVDVGAFPPGDVFEGRWFKDGTVVHTARTPVWLGTPHVTHTPAVQGRLVVGSTLTLVPGQWAGGWGPPWGASTYGRIYVCHSPDATDCFVLDPQAAVLEARWQGWYAFATSSFYSGRTSAIPAMAPWVYPYAQPRIFMSRLSHSGPLGPIAAPDPPSPSAWIRGGALRRDGWLRIARVTCAAPCNVTFTVSSRGRKTLRQTLTVSGMQALVIRPRRGTLRVSITVNGKVLAAGTSRWR